MKRFSILVILLLCLVPLGLVNAQGGAASYGTSVTGTLSATTPFAIYQFNGTAGDQIVVNVIEITPGLRPSVSLLAPNQQQIAVSAPDALGTGLTQLTYRLTQTGPHSLMVASTSGAAGDYVLRLDSVAASAGGTIPANTPVTLDIPPNALPTSLTFPALPTDQTLAIVSQTPGFAFLVQIFGPNGQLIGTLGGNSMPSAALTLGPGTGEYSLIIVASDLNTQGSVQILLGSSGSSTTIATQAPTGSTIATATPGSSSSAPPAATTPTVCTATSTVNVNIRYGPATNFSAFGSLFPSSPLPVIGRNSNASWYVVNSNGRQGWVASSVVSLSGPCDNLAYIQPPASPTPTYTPTPAYTATPLPASINFTVNGTNIVNIYYGDCVTVRWDTANVAAVYYRGEGVPGNSSRTECPTTTTSYELRVVLPDYSETYRTVAVNVNPATITPSPTPSP